MLLCIVLYNITYINACVHAHTYRIFHLITNIKKQTCTRGNGDSNKSGRSNICPANLNRAPLIHVNIKLVN